MWVDDLVYGSTDETFTGWVETEVGKKFTIGDCDDLTWFLGVSFKVSSERMSLSHSTYISNLLKKFGMENCKPVSTPLAERLTLSKDDSPMVGSDEEHQMKQLDYRGLVGSISYLAQTTRPDLAFSAHLLSRFLSNPVKLIGKQQSMCSATSEELLMWD